ncbi:MAG: carboxypeptidase-like regulatory domain-containing protein [Bacteroidaceae bacterium]|nr:carboxypeptidase-like regulatory domain-containing protein [Bacteroidaceae bacterium]
MTKRYSLFLLICLLSVARVSAQVITGVVTDGTTGETLPAVHVYYMDDKSTMVQTDINGKYKIAFRPGTLVFSMMGFDLKALEVKASQKQLNVKLQETASALREVEIVKKRKKYTRKNNPAVEMMRKVIAAKKNSNLREHDFLSYMKYEKMTLALNEFTDKVFEDDHFKRFPFLKEHVEMYPETGKLILPLTINEKVIQIIYRKDPKEEKSIIVGQREEGVTSLINTGEIMTGMLSDCFTDIDIY